ncbi:TlpA disulfide reductase family protein [Carboxylicivirga marina]|uniref:AhpC/TSA family protein n=1 Tax=Carboxylicivirga marina TaxID=2800988 RepID=A0ABS1HDY2_9BACT|nr:TlpA disulfide reductase family protein [Carboxylicivirga marina]MBK3515840.1 AhpC/TSA family protein [Carboxylicivirga marina]
MNTIKTALVSAIVALSLLSCSLGSKTIEANIEGLGNDTLYIKAIPVSSYYDRESVILDTIVSKDDRFSYDVQSEEPVLFYVFPKQKVYKNAKGVNKRPAQYYMTFLVNSGSKIEVSGRLEEWQLSYKAEGGEAFNHDYSVSRDSYLNLYKQLHQCDLKLDSVMRHKGGFSLLNELTQKRRGLFRAPSEPLMNYIKQNPGKDLAAYYLFNQRVDTVVKYYNHLSADVRDGAFKSILEHKKRAYDEKMEAKNAVIDLVEGKTAPDFTLKSISGDSLNLNALQHQYVVLDFWGSWCGWCITGFPKMKKYYAKYKGDIEFVGIACKDKESKWRKVVAEQDLKWLNVINDKKGDDDLTKLYQVYSYPTKIILDRDRKIVGRFSGETADFYIRLDELIHNN